jgi:ABC-type transport system involved in multi-copper enzyme maturation permease subunit
MRAVWTIAKLTFKEAVRNKVLYLLFFFALSIVCLSLIIGKLTVGDELKIIKDLGISSIHFFGVLITVFIGIGLVFREMEKRTVYLILSKPVQRYQFLLGKFLGLAVTLLVILIVLVAAFYAILVLKGDAASKLLWAFFLTYFEWLILAGIALVFSSFSTPFLSAMLTLAAFLVGHLTDSIFLLQNRIDSETVNLFLSALFYVLPNLELFNIRSQMVHELALPSYFVLKSSLYGLFYITALLLLSVRIFEKKDFA